MLLPAGSRESGAADRDAGTVGAHPARLLADCARYDRLRAPARDGGLMERL